MHSGDSGEVFRPPPVRDFLQDRAHPPKQSFLDKLIF
jgi:hypothetical protein